MCHRLLVVFQKRPIDVAEKNQSSWESKQNSANKSLEGWFTALQTYYF